MHPAASPLPTHPRPRPPVRRPFSPAQPRLGGGRSPGTACKYGGAAARGRGRGCSALRARVPRDSRGDPREWSGSGKPGPEARRPAGGPEEGTPGVGSGARARGRGRRSTGIGPGPVLRDAGWVPGASSGERSGGVGGDDRVRLRRGRGGQGGPRRDLPVPGAASPGRPPESLLSISRGRAVPPRARLVVFLLSSSTSSGCFCCRSARAPGAVSRNLMRPNWLFM